MSGMLLYVSGSPRRISTTDPIGAEVLGTLHLAIDPILEMLAQDAALLSGDDVSLTRPVLNSPGFLLMRRDTSCLYRMKNGERWILPPDLRKGMSDLFRRTGYTTLVVADPDDFSIVTPDDVKTTILELPA